MFWKENRPLSLQDIALVGSIGRVVLLENVIYKWILDSMNCLSSKNSTLSQDQKARLFQGAIKLHLQKDKSQHIGQLVSLSQIWIMYRHKKNSSFLVGWISILHEWLSYDLGIALYATKALANMDRDYEDYKYVDGVHIYYPQHRQEWVILIFSLSVRVHGGPACITFCVCLSLDQNLDWT